MKRIVVSRGVAHRGTLTTGAGDSDFHATKRYGTSKAAARVLVSNGTLGRSSHNGIHGNGAQHVVLKNLHVRDWEVAGIQLNGADNVAIVGCQVGPNARSVPAKAALSTPAS